MTNPTKIDYAAARERLASITSDPATRAGLERLAVTAARLCPHSVGFRTHY